VRLPSRCIARAPPTTTTAATTAATATATFHLECGADPAEKFGRVPKRADVVLLNV